LTAYQDITKWYDDKGETEKEEKERRERETNEMKAEEEEQERMKKEKAETAKQQVREDKEAREKEEQATSLKEVQKVAALSSLPQKGLFHSAFRYRCLILWIVFAHGLSRTTSPSNHTSLAPQTTCSDDRLFVSAC
jgi:phage-related minor tail protein